jgi:hypothetical protein
MLRSTPGQHRRGELHVPPDRHRRRREMDDQGAPIW